MENDLDQMNLKLKSKENNQAQQQLMDFLNLTQKQLGESLEAV